VLGTLLNGRFRLEEQIGSGGMSTVYRAFDEVLERSVAIKVMHASIAEDGIQLERFRREARTAAKMQHPHVVTVIDAGEDEGHPFIVLEYVEGETLKDRIRRCGPLPVAEAVAYAIEIGRALQAAHAERLVHRDVKPQNVLIDPEGRAKVTDFGITRSLDDAEGLTATGRVLGTTDYVSPEQALGEVVTEQSDIYSLGIVLFEMLVGRVPFRAESQVGVAMKHVREPMPDVQRLRPEISAALAAVVERATSKERKNRYPSIAPMLDDLEQALAVEVARHGHPTGEATSVIRALPRRSAEIVPARWRSPRLWAATLALVAIGAALVVVGVLLRAEEDKQPVAGPPPPPPPAQTVALSAAKDFDPGGDGKEHGYEVAHAIDNDPATTWSTENYTQGGGFGGKSGVGLYVTAKQPVAATQLDLWTRTPGYDVTIYAADPPGQAISDWGKAIARVKDVGSRERIELDTGGRQFRNYLIWITKLPDGKKADIAQIHLLGPT
jgi:tRNA A-37 threonylcarbamoyl transferase component Bud32